ncbi:MAG: 2-dehydropantoate 2-reductase [Actinomycetota bacterium]
MSTVAVVGVGAIGSAVAAAVADAGVHELRCCVRRPIDAVTVHRAKGPDGVADIATITDGIVTDPSQLGDAEVDWVLLATKTYQTTGAAAWLERLAGPGTRVAVLQNGVTHRERVAPLVPPGATVVPVVVYLPGERDDDGVVHQSSPGRLLVADDADGVELAGLFASSATKVRPVDDLLTAAWTKLVINSSSGPVALLRQPARVGSAPGLADLLRSMITETVAVARAEGAAMADDAVERFVDGLGFAGDHLSSIAADVIAGRPLEWEERNAVVGRLGRRHGIPTPTNDVITAMLRTASELVEDR